MEINNLTKMNTQTEKERQMRTTLYKLSLSALSGLNRLRHKLVHYEHRIYISGKITGIDDFEWYFLMSCNKVRELGYIPVNPCELPPRKSWGAYMLWDILELLTCSGIYMQSNYIDSKGAKIELKISKLLNKHVIFEK